MQTFIRFLAVMLIGGMITACVPAAPTVPAAVPTASPAPAASDAAVSVIATTDSGRTIRHPYGETVIPLAPSRIVSLDVADNLLALGIMPIAVGDWEKDYLPELADVPSVGHGTEPNLEVISSLQPDLIILHTEDDEFPLDQYELLNQIAPTIVITDPETDFRLAERELGLILDQADAVEIRIAEYEARIAAARTQIAALIGDETVALVNVRQDHYRLYGIKVGYTGPFLYGEMGMTPAALVQELVPEDANINISLETLPQLDADHIFVLYQTSLEQQWLDLQAQPLWQALPAVQAGHVYPVTGNYWYASGLLAHEYKIADVLTALGGDVAAVESTTTTTVASATFPLTITDAAGQEFTFDAPPKLGCDWYGCYEAMAELGIPLYAAAMAPEETTSAFYGPAGAPTYLIVDGDNPESWAAAEIDLYMMRVPADGSLDPIKAVAPIFYLHHPSYGDSSQTGYQAYFENLRILGQLTGQSAAADAAISRFETTLTRLKALSTPATQQQTVAVLFSGDGYRAIAPGNPFCTVLVEVGLGQCVGEGAASLEISAEAFLALNPDWIIYQGGDTSYQERTDPVWSQLTAVKEGHVFDAAGNRYYCCSTRGLIHALQDYVSHILPDSGIVAPGPVEAFDPLQSPLVAAQ